MQTNSKYSSILLYEAQMNPINEIVYFDDDKNKIKIKDSVVRVLNKNSDNEIVLLESGLEIPIEKIYRIDTELSPFHSDDTFSCDCV